MNWLAAFGFHFANNNDAESVSLPETSLEHPIVFVERFWKWRDSLYVVACRVLGDPSAATDVVERCFRRASPTPPRFHSDGAFGSWLLRVLLDEAMRELAARRHAARVMRQQHFPRMPQAMTAKLEFMDEFWCLDTTLQETL